MLNLFHSFGFSSSPDSQEMNEVEASNIETETEEGHLAGRPDEENREENKEEETDEKMIKMEIGKIEEEEEDSLRNKRLSSNNRQSCGSRCLLCMTCRCFALHGLAEERLLNAKKTSFETAYYYYH